ncbi:MAG: hypothetical protein GY847_32010 [Proteobacteria bacterium]|nr:hypothetical protein [Pseudomonadota bacterium]
MRVKDISSPFSFVRRTSSKTAAGAATPAFEANRRLFAGEFLLQKNQKCSGNVILARNDGCYSASRRTGAFRGDFWGMKLEWMAELGWNVTGQKNNTE